MMVYLVTLLVMLAAFMVVARPLIRSARDGGHDPGDVSSHNDLIGRRDAAYRAIKELDFEYQLGNLSESDYRGLRDRYRREAAAILREMDSATKTAGAGEASASSAATPAVASTASSQADPPCPSCGTPTAAGDRRCGSCGARLETGA